MDKDERLQKEGDRFYNDLRGYSIFKLAYYQCFKCKQPYFGGMRDCNQVQEAQEFKPEHLVCGKCSAESVGRGVQDCPKHKTDFIEFKCRFCCSVAVWFCFGTTHFCEPCHAKEVQGLRISSKTEKDLEQCTGPDNCKLKIVHPKNGNEFALGCGLCMDGQS